METNCLLSSESIKVEQDFETKPSGPIFPIFIKREIKPEADVEVDNENWTNDEEIDSLHRNLQGCKKEEDTVEEGLLHNAKHESVQVQLEDIYSERCSELVDPENLSHVLPENNSNKVHINNTECSSRAQDVAVNSHVELRIVDSKATVTHAGKKPYKCDVCGLSCSFNSHLIEHKRIHTGEKPYKCDVCGTLFTTSSNLKIHKRTHTGEKPYKCDVCDALFANISNLINHKRRHAGVKPHKCDVCGASFTTISNLKRHKRTHTGEKPYKCDVCEASFTCSSVLKNHERTHSGEKPYKCDVCGDSFTNNSPLKRHKRRHTGEKPYKCDMCGSSFSWSSSLKTHKRTHTVN